MLSLARYFFLIAGLLALVCSDALASLSVDLTVKRSEPIGQHLTFIKTGINLSPLQAYTEIQQRGIRSDQVSPNFGISSDIIWLRAVFTNPTDRQLSRFIWSESIWVDQMEFYAIDRKSNHATLVADIGDNVPFSQRASGTRHLSFEYSFAPGETEFLIKVRSNDPKTINLRVGDDRAYLNTNNLQIYSYGLLYGAILALVLFNVFMYASVKESYHLFFAAYLLAFLVMNIGYSGHGYMWLWPNSPAIQQHIVLFLMILYGTTGIKFALKFLHFDKTSPRMAIALNVINAFILVLTVCLALAKLHLVSAIISFTYIQVFSITMIALGLKAAQQKNALATYFLLATLAGAIGAAITGLTVIGIMPYSYIGLRAVDLGVALDVILLAFAVAYKFKILEKAKTIAEFSANTDPLTSLDNRRAFYQKADKLWSLGTRDRTPSSVVIVDIDHFKRVNDLYSHIGGDQVLMKIAGILKQALRGSDVVCRWGGEEFLIYLPETNENGARLLAEKIKTDITSETIRFLDQEIKVSASFGVSERIPSDDEIIEVIKRADKALYLAKENGRNQCQTWSELLTSKTR